MICENMILIFFFFRFKDNGQDFCISYTERNPFQPSTDPSISTALELILENKHWGKGCLSSLIVNVNGTNDAKYVMNFPCKI